MVTLVQCTDFQRFFLEVFEVFEVPFFFSAPSRLAISQKL
jgi:hypothetical protein